MEVLLIKDVRKLGHVGDVVDVTAGFARNYLMPQRLATEPTEVNLRAIEDLKKKAVVERARKSRAFNDLAEKLKDFSVSIEAAANPEGTLYGSVGPAHVAGALQAQGFLVLAEHVRLDPPIRTLDNKVVTLEFTDEIKTLIKVWVVREGALTSDDQSRPTDDQQQSADDDEE